MMPAEDPSLEFQRGRVAELLAVLELMAAGDTQKRLKISDRHDELDAIAHAVNVLVGELGWATSRVLEAHEERADAAERANASKGIFLRNISHEIRTPISAMVGIADLLASPTLSEQDRSELVRRLQANGLAVLSLLTDLLDLARLDADRIVLTPESVEVVDLVREVLASVEIESRAKGLDLRVDVTGEALGSIQTDRYRLRQILVNLITNAVKFTEAGSIVVSVRVQHSFDGDEWTIDITDTGIGIAADQHARLFEPFEQGSASIGRVYGGSGLGLALSRRLAEQLGGALTLLFSVPGQGTSFRLALKPLHVSPRPAPDHTGQTSDRAAISIKGLRILLAEDHRDLHMAMRRSLEEKGARVESAYDGREAMAKAMASSFDVVAMDLRMPHMSGLQVARELRRQGYRVPIIALTADPATLSREEALRAGCNACLSKPFRLDDLIAAISPSS
jgi:signal transduction histidine kinase